MTVFGMLRVTPITDEENTDAIVAALEALEEYDVTYETNPMATVIEAADVDELLAAVGAAHKTVSGDEVDTLLQINDLRTKEMEADDKVRAVEDELGREAKRDRD